jgi:hypothetical protein
MFVKNFVFCAFVLAVVCQCGAGIIAVTPATPVTVNVINASYASHSVGSTLIDIAGSWGKIGIYAMGYNENQGGSSYAGEVFLSVQAVLDGNGNGIRAAFGDNYALNLAEGATIDENLSFQANNADKSNLTYYYYYRYETFKDYTRTGNFRSGTSGIGGYVGLELTNNGQTYYGWMHLTVNNPDSNTGARVVIDNWAWNNTPDATIAAGSTVPEPATMALLGLGGLLLKRKR